MGEKKVFGFRYSPSPPLPAATVPKPSSLLLRSAILCLLLVFPGSGLYAYRPFFTPDAAVADRGEWLAEIGLDEWVRGGKEQKFLGPRLKINYGFAKDWEATAGAAVRAYQDENVSMGVEDIFSGVKRVVREGILQDKKGPSISAEAAVLFPSRATGEKNTGFAVLSSLSTGAGKMLFHTNLGFEYSRALMPGIVWGGVGEYFVTSGVSLVAEAFGGTERGRLPGTVFLAGIITRTAIGNFDLGIWKRSVDAPDDISFTIGTTIPLQ